MPLADALSYVPGLMTRPAEPDADRAALVRLVEWCGRYSPWIAPDPPAENGGAGITIEITGCAHLWGGEAVLAADLSRRLARAHGAGDGISHRIAIAGTLGAAWALARFAAAAGEPAIPPPERLREALAPLPVEALRLDPATAAGLHRVGLTRIGDLYPMPRAALARRFGDEVARRLDQAAGAAPEPLSPLGEAPTRRVRLSFAEPIADPADLAAATERLAGDLTGWLAREGVGARRLDLGFHRVDGRVEHIRLGTARPSRDPAHLADLLQARLDTIDPGLGVEDMILAAYTVETLGAEQADVLNLGLAPPLVGESQGTGLRTLAPLIDRLGAQLGHQALARLEARESHLPERASAPAAIAESQKILPLPPSAGGDGRVRGIGEKQRPHPPIAGAMGPSLSRNAGEGFKPPRPVRLFRPPEPIEAFWLLPDDPPFRFAWRRRRHLVAQTDGPERIAEEWWRPDAAGAAPIVRAEAIRDYYRVEDAEGRRFWLFRAGLPGHDPPPRWYLHGVFA